MYLPVDAEPSTLPEAVKKQLGQPEKSLSFELNADRKLPNADTNEVIEAISTQGFYIQMPTNIEDLLAKVSKQSEGSGNK